VNKNKKEERESGALHDARRVVAQGRDAAGGGTQGAWSRRDTDGESARPRGWQSARGEGAQGQRRTDVALVGQCSGASRGKGTAEKGAAQQQRPQGTR